MNDSLRAFVKALNAEIRRDMNDTTDAMAGGACTDYSTYQHSCGVIQGLARAEAYLLDLAKKADEPDDDSDS
jgi:hypothetical protein